MPAAPIRDFALASETLGKTGGDLWILPLAKGESPPAAMRALAGGEAGPLNGLLQSGDWKAELGDTALLYGAGESFRRVLVLGLGEAQQLHRDRIRQAVAAAARRARDLGVESVALGLPLSPALSLPVSEQIELSVEGALLGAYQYTSLKTIEREKFKTIGRWNFTLPDQADAGQAHQALERGRIRGEAVNFVRDLGNEPANRLTPGRMVEWAREIASQEGLKLTVLDREAAAREGMGAFLSVARGSEEPPYFILLEYDGGGPTAPRIGLVGKGITFDSGGISIKPALKMEEMKFDMCGAAAVLGTMKSLRRLRIPVNVVAAMPVTENLPSGKATKPGDVVTSYSGKTVEIQNTDAEGRLILCDALAYVVRNYRPAALIDMATLTGAVIIALGHYGAAVLTNHEDLAQRIQAAAEKSGDRTWRLPIWEEYSEHLKSDCADLKNIADGNAGGGTIAGAAFLAAFVEQVPWAHIDIAGTAWWDKDRPHLPKGPSGFGVRLLLDLLEGYSR